MNISNMHVHLTCICISLDYEPKSRDHAIWINPSLSVETRACGFGAPGQHVAYLQLQVTYNTASTCS